MIIFEIFIAGLNCRAGYATENNQFPEKRIVIAWHDRIVGLASSLRNKKKRLHLIHIALVASRGIFFWMSPQLNCLLVKSTPLL